MSALGHKQTCAAQKGMSALPPIADICDALGRVSTLLSAERPIDIGFGSTAQKVKH